MTCSPRSRHLIQKRIRIDYTSKQALGHQGECPPTTKFIDSETTELAQCSRIDNFCRGPLPLATRGCEAP